MLWKISKEFLMKTKDWKTDKNLWKNKVYLTEG